MNLTIKTVKPKRVFNITLTEDEAFKFALFLGATSNCNYSDAVNKYWDTELNPADFEFLSTPLYSPLRNALQKRFDVVFNKYKNNH